MWRRCRLTSLCGWDRFSVWRVRCLSAWLGSMMKWTRYKFKHAQPHTHRFWLKFSSRSVLKPQKHIWRHQLSYRSAERKDRRKESGETSFLHTHTCLFPMAFALTLMNYAASRSLFFLFLPFSLPLSQSVAAGGVCVSTFVGAFGEQCRYFDWCGVTWFHVNASALREFTLNYAPHCARPMKY